MSWFKRVQEGILTSTNEKIEVPDGLWTQCPSCKKASHVKELINHLHTCPHCGYHYKIGSAEYFELLFEHQSAEELFGNLVSADPLGFKDTKPYPERIEASRKKTQLNDAVRCAQGKVGPHQVVVACMDFNFIGGSMGSVVGEKICRSINHAVQHRLPFIMISKSGGARMMEGGLSLMQMARTSAHLTRLHDARLPYISILTDPTTGGVTASFAMLGDFNIAEPGALIGFAGPRVIRETIGKSLPEGFQSAEFLLEHGFIDFIVERKRMREKLIRLLSLIA
jgi:acetyl-CoA carboxylase carboxyl transferase subunit beta